MVLSRSDVEIFTDGSCLGNPGPGGWAALLRMGEQEREIQGCAGATTNNRMELTAVIEALQVLKRPCRVTIMTDSEYVRRGMTEWLANWRRRNWRTAAGKPVANRDLWEVLAEAIAAHEIEWRWVRGHAGHAENERVDKAARAAASEQTQSG